MEEAEEERRPAIARGPAANAVLVINALRKRDEEDARADAAAEAARNAKQGGTRRRRHRRNRRTRRHR